jgi:hypothetical protein
MKTLLIPTDFNVESLNYVPNVVQRFYPEKIDIILVHMMKITDSISELLMLSRRSAEYQHISNEFYHTCNQLKERYPENINNIRIEFFYGSTISVFKNFLEANAVDNIVCLNGYNYKLLNKNSIEPTVLTSRSNLEMVYVNCSQTSQPEPAVTANVLEEQEV